MDDIDESYYNNIAIWDGSGISGKQKFNTNKTYNHLAKEEYLPKGYSYTINGDIVKEDEDESLRVISLRHKITLHEMFLSENNYEEEFEEWVKKRLIKEKLREGK